MPIVKQKLEITHIDNEKEKVFMDLTVCVFGSGDLAVGPVYRPEDLSTPSGIIIGQSKKNRPIGTDSNPGSFDHYNDNTEGVQLIFDGPNKLDSLDVVLEELRSLKEEWSKAAEHQKS